jgi:hypothetical protein
VILAIVLLNTHDRLRRVPGAEVDVRPDEPALAAR